MALLQLRTSGAQPIHEARKGTGARSMLSLLRAVMSLVAATGFFPIVLHNSQSSPEPDHHPGVVRPPS